MFNQQDSIEVDNIIGHRAPHDRRKKGIQYQVLWKGYKQDETTWETFQNLKNCQDLLRNYHELHPQLPNPFKTKQKDNKDDVFDPQRPTHKKFGPKRPRGRPPKNLIEKVWKGTYEDQVHRESPINDGFNVRMQGTEKSMGGTDEIKVTKVFAHPHTNQIFYEVSQFGQVSLKPRKWLLAKSKQALILFYESLMVIKEQ